MDLPWTYVHIDADVPETNMILQPTDSLDFENRNVNANINMKSSKIIANISLKLRRYQTGIPNFHIL